MATEGRDKGGKLALITSCLNAGKVSGAERANERRENEARAGNLDSPFPVMTGSFPIVCCLVGVVCVCEDITTKMSRFPRA